MKITKEFVDSFYACMKHWRCTEEEIAYEKQRARDNYLDASVCFISIAKNLALK